MALDEEYYRKLNESEQRFYGIINEIRIQMGMPTVEVPFYGPKESDASVEPNEDEIHTRSKNELQQQLESISRIVVGGFDDPEFTSCHSELSEMSRSQGNQPGLCREKDSSTSRELLSSSFLLQTPNSSCHDARGDSVTKVDGDRQILYVSSMEDSCPSKTEDDLSEIDATIDTSIHEILPGRFVHDEKQSLLNAHHMFDEMSKGKVDVFQPLKVISNSSLEIVAFEMESEELGDDSMASTEIRWDDFKINSLELDIPIAYKVLDELPENKFGLFMPCVEFKKHSDLKLEFCTGISNLNSTNKDPIWTVGRGTTMNLVDSCIVWEGNIALVFDPGGVFDHGSFLFELSCAATLVLVLDELILIFDPGGEWSININIFNRECC